MHPKLPRLLSAAPIAHRTVRRLKLALLASIALSLVACASHPNVDAGVIPAYTFTSDGPASLVKPRPKVRLDEIDDAFCVFDVTIQVRPSGLSENYTTPRACVGISGWDTSAVWPPSGPLRFSWRATPDGELIHRELDLIALSKRWQIQGGRITAILKKTGLRVDLNEPDRAKPVSFGSGVFYSKPAVTIYED